MLATATVDVFAPHVGDVFQVTVGDGARLELTLASARVAGPPGLAGGRQPFALLFHGPLEPVLPQHIYEFRHPVLGELGLFIVPLGPEPGEAAMRYQAVFT